MVPQDKDHHFCARIYQVGINRCVDVPERVSRALSLEKHVPVIGNVGGEKLRSTLVPRGGGLFRLFIHSRIWKKLGVDSDDTVGITLKRDRKAGDVQLPPVIAAAFPRGSEALAALNAQTAATRRRFVSWVIEARMTKTQDRRIRQFTDMILAQYRKKNRE